MSETDHTLINHAMQVFRRDRPLLSVGMQDEPTRCYRINLQWCKYVAGALHELINIQAWQDAADERHSAIQQLLVLLEGESCMDCDNVEDCLESSTIINNITTNITNVTQAQEACCEQVSEVTNIYPPPPTPAQAIDLCSSATYVATKLSEIWHDIVADAQVITWEEFIGAFIPNNQGFDVGLLKLLWDFVVSNANPNLVDEGEAAFDEIVKIVFCNEFDRDLIDLEIDASATITSDAKGLWRGALSTVTDGRIASWVFLGSLEGLSNTGCVCFEICGLHDFTIDDGEWTINDDDFDHPGFYDTGLGWRADPSPLNGVNQNNVIFIRKTFAARIIQTVQMFYSLTKGEWTGSTNDNIVTVVGLLAGVLVLQETISYAAAVNGDDQELTLTINDEIDEIQLFVRSSRDVTIPDPIGDALITACAVVCE